jgi:hypothetical protein
VRNHRIAIAAVALLLSAAAPAAANVGVRAAPSASRTHARAVAVTVPVRIVAGNVLVAMVTARIPAGAPLRAPAHWRLANRSSARAGAVVLTQAVFVHVARAGDARRYVFKASVPTTIAVKLLVLRGADGKRTIGALETRSVTTKSRLTSPALAAAHLGDLLVVQMASTAPRPIRAPSGSSVHPIRRLSVTVVTRPIHSTAPVQPVPMTSSGPARILAFWVRARRGTHSHSDPSEPTTPTKPKPPSTPTTPVPPSTPVPPPLPPITPTGDLLVSDTFSVPDGLITNEYAFFNALDLSSLLSPTWQLDSGSLFATGGTGSTGVPDDVEPNAHSTNGTDSAIFRLVTRRADLGDVSVSFRLDNIGLTQTSSTPSVDWDGVHVFLRYQSEFSLYYASINRRDGTAVIKKKVPGGPDNGGTYYELTPYVSHAVPYGEWQDITATVQTNADGSVTIRLLSGGQLVVAATDSGTGGPPITAPGRVGLRGDNCNFRFDDFRVAAL